jgi:hypothetical protein
MAVPRDAPGPPGRRAVGCCEYAAVMRVRSTRDRGPSVSLSSHGSISTRRSPVNRVLRALTALVTVWCLGCSAYEPLLAGLLGTSAGLGMACDSEGEMSGSATVTAGASHDAGDAKVASAAAATPDRGFACSCQSCHSAAPVVLSVVSQAALTAYLPESTPASPLSIARAPLVPPPQTPPQGA